MKRVAVFFTLCFGFGIAFGHEFWLQPSRFFANVGDRIQVQVLVGEGFAGERSEGKKNRILQYRHHTASNSTDLAPTLTGDTYGDVSVLLSTPGTHLFSFANTPKFLSMRADSFLLYLQEDGLDTVIATRRQRGETDKPSRELYQRCVKTLVQAGPATDNAFAKNTGLMLEIFPAKNPYTQRPGQMAHFRIRFGDKPLAGALVRCWNRDAANHLTEEKQRSDAQGHIQFRLRAGASMISLVQMVPSKDTTADWHSYWGSLTFGCR